MNKRLNTQINNLANIISSKDKMREMLRQGNEKLQNLSPCFWDESSECFDIFDPAYYYGEKRISVADMIDQCIYFDKASMCCLFKQSGILYMVETFEYERRMHHFMCAGFSPRDALALAKL